MRINPGTLTRSTAASAVLTVAEYVIARLRNLPIKHPAPFQEA